MKIHVHRNLNVILKLQIMLLKVLNFIGVWVREKRGEERGILRNCQQK